MKNKLSLDEHLKKLVEEMLEKEKIFAETMKKLNSEFLPICTSKDFNDNILPQKFKDIMLDIYRKVEQAAKKLKKKFYALHSALYKTQPFEVNTVIEIINDIKKYYSKYANTISLANMMHYELNLKYNSKNKLFIEIFNEIKRLAPNIEYKVGTFDSALMIPVQTAPRHPLLFREIQKYINKILTDLNPNSNKYKNYKIISEEINKLMNEFKKNININNVILNYRKFLENYKNIKQGLKNQRATTNTVYYYTRKAMYGKKSKKTRNHQQNLENEILNQIENIKKFSKKDYLTKMTELKNLLTTSLKYEDIKHKEARTTFKKLCLNMQKELDTLIDNYDSLSSKIKNVPPSPRTSLNM